MQCWLKCIAAFSAVGLCAVNGVSAQVQIQIQAQPARMAACFNIQMAEPIMAITSYGVAPNRLANSDAVFVGRVVAFEPMDIEAVPAKGQPKVAYRIAVIQVTETIRGLKKDAQTVRVGFPVGNNGQAGGFGNVQIQVQPAVPGGAAIARRPFIQSINLQVGHDGLFFLAKHETESFFLAPTYQTFVNRQNNPTFDNDVKSAKQVCKVLDNPVAALKSQDKDERYTAAAVLVSKYRSNSTGLPMKEVPISAEESKLILKAMAEGDWAIGRFNATVPSAYELFNQLGITVNDGYKLVNVRNQQDIMQTMQKWIAENADKYQIKKLVADPNAKAVPMPVQGGAIRGGVGGRRAISACSAPVPTPGQALPVPALRHVEPTAVLEKTNQSAARVAASVEGKKSP